MRVFLTVLSVFLTPAFAQNLAENLAPYVPSPQVVVDKMLESAKVKPGETVYDIGSGDGRIVITAVQKFKARAVGIELSPELCRHAEEKIKALGIQEKAKVIQGNALRTDLSPADVVTMYLLTSSNERMRPILERQLKPGARVVSLDFEFRGWKPAETLKVTADNRARTIYVYEMGKLK